MVLFFRFFAGEGAVQNFIISFAHKTSTIKPRAVRLEAEASMEQRARERRRKEFAAEFIIDVDFAAGNDSLSHLFLFSSAKTPLMFLLFASASHRQCLSHSHARSEIVRA
jgi:hypothetical protein